MTLIELEAQRRAAAKALGIRYYKLTKSQAMEALCQANAHKKTGAVIGNPFPSHKETAE
jgi:hypothetical protein